jgi:hypothetical protein
MKSQSTNRTRAIEEVKKELAARDRIWAKVGGFFTNHEYQKRYDTMKTVQAVLENMNNADFDKFSQTVPVPEIKTLF